MDEKLPTRNLKYDGYRLRLERDHDRVRLNGIGRRTIVCMLVIVALAMIWKALGH